MLDILMHLIPGLAEPIHFLSIYAAIALGALTCFFGYRLRTFWYGLVVFCIGGLAGYLISRGFLPEKSTLCLLIGLGCGLLFSLFTYRFYQLVTFFVVFVAVFTLGCDLLSSLNFWVCVGISGAAGIFAGVLGAKLRFVAVIAVTSISGGWQMASNLVACIPELSMKIQLLLALLFIAAGFLFQYFRAPKQAK